MNAADVPEHGPALDAAAAATAAAHRGRLLAARAPRPAWLAPGTGETFLDAAARAARSPGGDATAAAAWLLDNLYVARRVVAGLRTDLSRAFRSQLPCLPAGLAAPEGAGPPVLGDAPVPRIVAVAEAFLAASGLQLSAPLLAGFLERYQADVPLRTAELWALPIALRLRLLDHLAHALRALFPGLPSSPAPLFPVPEQLGDPNEVVARSLTALAVAARLSWQDLFEALSPVERVLAEDPAGVHARMTFDSRDRYRRAVEEIAVWSGREEPDVARAAIVHARAAPAGAVEGHVGHWLTGAGRRALEAELGARPPLRIRVARWFADRALPAYLAALAAAMLLALFPPALLLAMHGATPWQWVVGLLLALLPATMVATALVNWAVTQVVPPRTLPRLALRDGLPEGSETAILVPALVRDPRDAVRLAERLEQHFLASRDPRFAFVLLSDLPDAPTPEMPDDAAIEAALVAAVEELNRRHAGRDGVGPFHLLHRRRSWCETQQAWLGWERKRGKIEAFNRLVLDGAVEPFPLRVGATDRLRRCRMALTLDADTRLAPGAALRLVGTMMHPVNRPLVDPGTGRVVRGHAILQPRVEPLPGVEGQSLYGRLQAGDATIDVYSRAVSDVYQDLFGAGIFAGKGLYDIAAFDACLAGRVPPGRILSHDLFEGLHARAALVSDVVVFEQWPESHAEQAARVHRWIRGDWQLLPWLAPRVPRADGSRVPTSFSLLDRLKIADNLRRSLVPPSLVALGVAGWLWLPGPPLAWTALVLLAPGLAMLTDFLTGLARGRLLLSLRSPWRPFGESFGRYLLGVTFLLDEARIALDAILRTLARLKSGRRLLEWRTADEVRSRTAAEPPARAQLSALRASLVAAVALGGLLALLRPSALASALPLLLPWLAAPAVAALTARPRVVARPRLEEGDVRFLREVARRTWYFFEAFVRPEHNWLPPDNFHEVGLEEEVTRTSPTNIGMMFLASLAAVRFGHLSLPALVERTRLALEALERLERHRGHVLNWIDIRTLKPLEPRYVSTVDSGNLAVSLVALAAGLRALREEPVVTAARFDGLVDLLSILAGSCGKIADARDGSAARAEAAAAREALFNLAETVAEVRNEPRRWAGFAEQVHAQLLPRIGESLAEAVAGWADASPEVLADVEAWYERATAHAEELARDLALWPEPEALAAGLPPELGVPVAEIFARAGARTLAGRAACFDAAAALLEDAEGQGGAAKAGPLAARVRAAAEAGRDLDARLEALAGRARALAAEMDFAFLYDESARLFRIGYNLSVGQPDRNVYDLLASEARLASYFAIAKGDVPEEHWAQLGRPVIRSREGLVLASWQGSMFEYLMPRLLLRPPPESLLAEAERTAVRVQIAHGRRHGLPWGVSESGFAARDVSGHHHYQGFGVPGLGIRRGLDDDRVVAPYATLLAFPVLPGPALANLRALAGMGLLRRYGFLEAADFTPGRVPVGQRFLPVREYMAHHQGMGLAALANGLFDDWLVTLFTSDPEMAVFDLLLAERTPWSAPADPGAVAEVAAAVEAPAEPGFPSWAPVPEPEVSPLHVFGNGRMRVQLASRGGLALFHEGVLMARTPGIGTGAEQFLPILLVDRVQGEAWRPGVGSARTEEADAWSLTCTPHGAVIRDRGLGLGFALETTVAANDDLECLRVGLTNEELVPREIDLVMFRELVIDAPADHARHPAFSRMFVETDWLADREALVARRRARRSEESEPLLLMRVIADDPAVRTIGHETDRARLFGQGADPFLPAFGPFSGTTGFTLDPVAAIAVKLRLPPNGHVDLAVLTAVASTRAAAEAVLDRYQTLAAIDWAIDSARKTTARELARLGFRSGEPEAMQQLLSRVLQPLRLAAPPMLLPKPGSGQPALWAGGISGDHPLVVLRCGEGRGLPLLPVMLRLYRRWSALGVTVDIVLLHGGEQGYSEPVRDRLLQQLRAGGVLDRLGHRGGIHIVSSEFASLAEAVLAAAVLVLDAAEERLSDALPPVPRAPELPPFTPMGEPAPEMPRPPEEEPPLVLGNGHGGFLAPSGDYLITGTPPPAPWSNVIANARFGTLVDHRGLGFSWAGNSGEFRLTAWVQDPVLAPAGEALYLRDEVTAEVWSPIPAPGTGSVCHRPGETVFAREDHGLSQQLTVAVAPEEPVKILRLRLANRTESPRRLTATFFADWLLGPATADASPWLEAAWDPDCSAILARNRRMPDFAEAVAFVTSDRPPHGLTTSRSAFLGPRGDRAMPDALRRWGLATVLGNRGGDCAAAYQIHLDLGPGEEGEAIFLLGCGDTVAEAQALARAWRATDHAPRALARARDAWDRLLAAVEVRTPDPAFDLMVNRWLPTQALAARVHARAGPSQASGAFGFRDQLQDVLALAWHDPSLARRHILEAAAHQFTEGDVLHWWHPPGGQGVRTRCSDDLLWLPYAAASYVEMTGDTGILSERVPFLVGSPLAAGERERYGTWAAGPSAPLLEHLVRALARGWQIGPDGLPLIGTGDWNDGLDRVGARGRGTSVWLGWFLIATADAFCRLAERIDRPDLAAPWPARRAALRQALESAGWDGAWYLRAIDDDGIAWGSSRSEACRIDLIAQAWAVLSGAAEPERAARAMAAARAQLARDDDDLVLLLTPPFGRGRRDPGYIAAYPPGIRENGGQYSHAAAWFGMALARMGDGAGAKAVFDRINPIVRSRNREAAARYRTEPYACAADIGGVAPHHGRGGWTWYTGAAGWTFRLGVESILGLRLVEERLAIAPCLPPEWPGAEAVVRRGSGAIRVEITGGGSGPWVIEAEGRRVEGPVAFPAEGERRVHVRRARAEPAIPRPAAQAEEGLAR